jgi:uncharacterized protein (DUF302 family)
MKKVFPLLIFLFLGTGLLIGQSYKPYTIGAETTGSIADVKTKVKTSLKENKFTVVGEYKPASDANRWLIVVTCSELKSAVKKVGGTTGFALTLRVAVTKEGSKTIVSYTTPEYWGNAYFQKNYSKVSSLYSTLSKRLKSALAGLGTNSGTMFGAKKGMTASALQKYHYMMGMPYFEDNVELNSFSSHSAAVSKIDGNFKKGVKDMVKVYSVALPDKKLKLYGVGFRGEKGESAFMPTIDIGKPKHTAFLPYEMLVYDNKVYMLHGRYRIAISFPDLSMGTFMKIVSTPGNIENFLESATK